MADAKLNDDVEEIPQPIRGNKISKKNKKKNKNQQQDLEEDSAGTPNIVVIMLRSMDGITHKNSHKLEAFQAVKMICCLCRETSGKFNFFTSPLQ